MHFILKRVALSCVVLCVFASDARSQEGTPQASSWTLGFGAHGGVESNVAPGEGDESDDVGTRFLARIGHARPLRRGQLDFNGELTQFLYSRSSMNQLTYGLGGGFSHSLTRRLTLTASDSLTHAYAQDVQGLTDLGLVFPRVLTRFNTAAATLSYAWSRRTQAQWSVSSQTVTFDSSRLSPGSSITTRGSLTRQVTRTQNVGFSFGHTFSNATTGDIQGLLGTYQASFGSAFSITAAGGVRPYTLHGDSKLHIAPGGSIGVVAKLGSGSLTGSYEHAVEQAFGIDDGTHLAHRFNGAYGVVLGRRFSIDASASYGLNTYPRLPDLRLVGRTGNLRAGYLVADSLSVSAGYSLWTREEVNRPIETSTRADVSLTYGFKW